MSFRLHTPFLGSLFLAVIWSASAGCSSSDADDSSGGSSGSGGNASSGGGASSGNGNGSSGDGASSGSSGDGASSGGGASSSGGASSGGPAPTPGTRFSDTSTAWAVPANSPYGNGYSAVATNSWTTMDLDGDGKPDLVVPVDATESNRTWKVYKNTGSGFATTSTAWTVPANSPYGNGYSAVATNSWTTMDLDGDGKPDLVVPVEATEENRTWKVYANTGSGFSTTSADWSVPANAPYGNGYSAVATNSWTTMDLDGDRKPDLVVPADATESNRTWKVYKNTP